MQDKLERLRSILRGGGRTLVAYSGGVDSVFLAVVARQVLGEGMQAVIADSPSLPRRELAEAVALGKQFGFPVRVMATAELANPSYASNPVNRCYFCKSELFVELTAMAKVERWETIVYGENASDAGDYRPGAAAAAEFAVRAPLKEAGLTKAEIRALSAQLGLPTAEKPQLACLASRIPHGEPVTTEALAMIEAAENVLRDAGFYEVRVRHHGGENAKSQSPNSKAALARIEVGADEVGRFFEGDLRARVTAELQRIGYAHVTLDLQGYRRGGAQEILMKGMGAK